MALILGCQEISKLGKLTAGERREQEIEGCVGEAAMPGILGCICTSSLEGEGTWRG